MGQILTYCDLIECIYKKMLHRQCTQIKFKKYQIIHMNNCDLRIEKIVYAVMHKQFTSILHRHSISIVYSVKSFHYIPFNYMTWTNVKLLLDVIKLISTDGTYLLNSYG
jgi:hypothetical protein